MRKNGSLWIGVLIAMILVALPEQGVWAQGRISGKLSGEYDFFSGEVGEKEGPNSRDAKVGFYVSGRGALRMFQYMGKAASMKACDGSDTEEIRLKGNLLCSRNKATGEAMCAVGIDLHTGKSVDTIDPC